VHIAKDFLDLVGVPPDPRAFWGNCR
jgi:hypothetical protein